VRHLFLQQVSLSNVPRIFTATNLISKGSHGNPSKDNKFQVKEPHGNDSTPSHPKVHGNNSTTLGCSRTSRQQRGNANKLNTTMSHKGSSRQLARTPNTKCPKGCSRLPIQLKDPRQSTQPQKGSQGTSRQQVYNQTHQ